jgi:hypothetical protein
MFKAMVMICFLNAPPGSCVTFEDTTGLKEIREHCYVRMLEMVDQLKTVPHLIPPPYSIAYKCEEIEST